jgi:hypothetical protein
VIAEPADDELFIELTRGMQLHLDRDEMVAVASQPPERPKFDEEEDEASEKPEPAAGPA